VEKKTRELMIQIRGLLLVNDLAVFLNGREFSEEREFLDQLPGFLRETYRLQYLSVFDIRGPGAGRQKAECFETPAAGRNVSGRLESLEARFVKRIRAHPGRIIRQNRSVVVCAFPVVVGDKPDYVIFLVASSRSLQLLFDTADTVSNMVAMKIDSLRITRLKIESEKLASIGQFASTVVHDIKNPLTVIKSFVEALHDPDFSEEEKRGYYQTLRTEIELLTNMLNDILDFSRGQLNLTKEAVDIDRLLADIARFYAKTFHDRKLILHCTTDCGIVAEIDRNRVWRSVGNLVQNAIDVLPQGGEIRIDAVRDGEWLMLSVRDNGPGIPQEVRESLFQPFFTFGKKGGTGLGLSIVKKIAESHGGVLRFETKLDEGTVFTMRLPIRAS
jgi:signal transduction histidine kinase